MKRDPYEVLGVPRDAGDQEIKSAYRSRARQVHPDVSDDPSAEESFKELSEAYEILSDPQRRAAYDHYGHDGVRGFGAGGGGGTGGFGGFTDFSDLFDAFFGGDIFGGGRARPQGPVRGQDVAASLELDLSEAAFGTSRNVKLHVLDICKTCDGVGSKDPSSISTCPDCQGSGRVRTVRRSPIGQFVQTGPCRRCGGEGRLIDDPCPTCRGTGRAYRDKTVVVEVPAGIATGQRIRISGQGEAGERGGPPGDLYVQVSVAPDEVFERVGDDVVYRQDLTVVQASLGARLSVPTLDGEEEVEFPPGTQPGEVKILRGRGVPHLRRGGRGDQHVLVNVMVPRNLNEHQKELLRELDDCCGMEHYDRRPEGILQRIRNFITG